MGRHTLRITLQETDESVAIKLEGRIAGPWVGELRNAWAEAAPRVGTRELSIDLSDVTYADASGKQVLKNICAQTRAQFVTSTPWTQFLAEEVTASKTNRCEGAEHASNN
jgi:anti-anti-sigma regulatory factor